MIPTRKTGKSGIMTTTPAASTAMTKIESKSIFFTSREELRRCLILMMVSSIVISSSKKISLGVSSTILSLFSRIEIFWILQKRILFLIIFSICKLKKLCISLNFLYELIKRNIKLFNLVYIKS